jgi:hypothetical protein
MQFHDYFFTPYFNSRAAVYLAREICLLFLRFSTACSACFITGGDYVVSP